MRSDSGCPSVQSSSDWTLPPSVELCSFHLDALELAPSPKREADSAGSSARPDMRTSAFGGRVSSAAAGSTPQRIDACALMHAHVGRYTYRRREHVSPASTGVDRCG